MNKIKSLILILLRITLYGLSQVVLKKKDLWVFGAWFGQRYSDNPKVFFEYINANQQQINAIWISKENTIFEQVRRLGFTAYHEKSIQGVWYQLRAEFVFVCQAHTDDLFAPCIGRKTKVVNLWHGLPLKKIMYDVFGDKKNNKNWKGRFLDALSPYEKIRNDYLIATSEETQNTLSKAFRLPKERVLITGFPRNDVFLQTKINASNEKYQCIYMPTFRGGIGGDVNVHRLYPKRKIQLAFAFKNATTVTTKSKDLAKKVVEIEPNSHVKTIYNGVNFEQFIVTIKPENTQLKLLFIGNLIKTKGVFELIDAALLLKQKNIAFQLTLIGNGPEKSALNALITKNNLNDVVKLIGGVPHKELNQKLAQVHALILPSYREGVPNVIMEALASGTPVIATKVGGIPEVINNGKNGILINSYASKSIVEGVMRFKTKNWSGINIRKSISSFTWQNTSDSFLESFK